MSGLNWLRAARVELNAPLIEVESDSVSSAPVADVEDALVAFDGSFAHIAPRPPSEDVPVRVSVVPSSSLRRVTYDQPPRSGSWTTW